ncbi:MAG: YDG domain-containing protein, partial [Pseudomonadota bacterium]
MNHIYRSLWNAKTGAFVAVSENTRGGGAGASSGGGGTASNGFTLKTLALSVMMAFGAPAYALPTDGVVTSGEATITSGASSMNIKQTSQNVSLNWESFSIGKGEAVNFLQPNSNSVALNRVLGADPSSILGTLTANGKVFLVNPNGILFGKGASVNVGGLVASTLGLSDADFNAGKYRFEGDSEAGVVNQGSIKAAGGYVAMLGARVSNEGVIAARLGTVALAAGKAITLDVAGDGLLNVTVDKGALDALADNGGLIQADGGRVLMNAQAAGSLLHTVVNNSGIVQAQAIENRGGVIRLSGGNVINSGALDASGANGGGGRIDVNAGNTVVNSGSVSANGVRGGTINVTGTNVVESGRYDASGTVAGGGIAIGAAKHLEQTTASTVKADGGSDVGGSVRIEAGADALLSGKVSVTGAQGGEIAVTAPELLVAGASLDASGADKGGRIRVGGGWQGGDTDLANAGRTRLSAAKLDVSATGNGTGGTAVVWSEQETLFDGTIKAKGGALGGDGGKVEVSSHGQLGFGGSVDAAAPKGQNGMLLLDPKNIELVASAPGFSHISLPVPAAASGSFFNNLTELKQNGVATGYIVISSPYDSTTASQAGAVRLYDTRTGALISTLLGARANDNVGTTVTPLSTGNYVVTSPTWDSGRFASDAGAITFGNGTTGVGGLVSASNSLVGGYSEQLGIYPIIELANGNYLVQAPNWNESTGAVAWGSGTLGVKGAINANNSLIGSTAGDTVGNQVVLLTNGNYVVTAPGWDKGALADAGAAMWVDGTVGATGTISATTSLVGTAANDFVGSHVVALSNGHYAVAASGWDSPGLVDAGAITWGNGTTGLVGEISAASSVVGSVPSVYIGLTALTNGNLVASTSWINQGGAVTWIDGSKATAGTILASNSLLGNKQYDLQSVTPLLNGNYVVSSQWWDNGAVENVGHVTFRDGSMPTSGVVSPEISLVGTLPNDMVGSDTIRTLANGNYVVSSAYWHGRIGAVTWGSGTTGVAGVVSPNNSLTGQTAGDMVGVGNVIELKNGNYIVRVPDWNEARGAVTWGSGTLGVRGLVSAANSLVGTAPNDRIGVHRVVLLDNGNYVVPSPEWDNGVFINAGAVTWGDASKGTVGSVSASNSLVGSYHNEYIGNVKALSNGNYVAFSSGWTNNGSGQSIGAATWGNGETGISGVITAANSLVGSRAFDYVGSYVMPLNNGNYVVSSPSWSMGTGKERSGAATWADGTVGLAGVVSTANSLHGVRKDDQVGSLLAELTDGNYLVGSPYFQSNGFAMAGAATLAAGNGGTIGPVTSANSLLGSSAGERLGAGVRTLSDGRAFLISNSIDPARMDIIGPPATALTNPMTFSSNAGGNSKILVSSLTAMLNAGTDVVLQANNDITVSHAVMANNPNGDGGNLTLQAGRSILVNASIGTDNGSVTLSANDTAANGVISAERDAGAAQIYMAPGTSINAGTGSVNLTLRDGAGLANSTSGNITLAGVAAQRISAVNGGQTAGSGIVLNGILSASAGSGDAIVLSGQKFTNNVGPSALSTQAGGRWLVWSFDPAANTRNGLDYAFKQYDAVFGITPVLGTGNGMLYTLAPTVTAGLTGTVSKTYDGTASAPLTAANYTVSGMVVGDTVLLNNPSAGAYTSAGTAPGVRDAGTGKTVEVSGIAVASASEGAAAVYGYRIASGSASLAGASITPKALSATATASNKTYDGNTGASATLNLVGMVGSETLAATGSASFNSKDVLTANLVTVNSTALADGTGLASNYNLAAGQTAAASITPKALTASATAANKTYDGSTAANATLAIASGLVAGETLTATGTAKFNSKDVVAANLVTVDGTTLADGTGLASNYSLAAGQSAAASITAKALTASATAANKVYDGTTAANATLSITGGLVGAETVGATGSATFNSKDVAAANLVTVKSTTLANGTGLASNYSLGAGQTAAASITPKALTANTTAANKTYDGTTAANAALAIASGLVGTDTVTATGTASFNSKDVLAANLVTVNSTTLANGTGLASNYSLAAGQSVAASITPKALTASATAANKTYDGTTAANAALAIASGLVGAETVTATGTASFNSKDVVAANLVTVNSTTLANGTGLASN